MKMMIIMGWCSRVTTQCDGHDLIKNGSGKILCVVGFMILFLLNIKEDEGYYMDL